MKSKIVAGLSKKKIAILVLILTIIIIIAIVLYITLRKRKHENNKFRMFGFESAPLTGYWMWTWGGEGGSNPPNMCDIGIRFGGESPRDAIINNINQVGSLTSAREKFLNLGGGTDTGIWKLSDFDYINNNLSNIKSKGWTGVCFDIEVCPPGVSFVQAFSDCFAKCKAAGLKVLVTMSHIIPYSCQSGSGQGMDLVNSWIKDTNIDYLSPQLYSTGKILEPTDLSLFSKASAKIVPSIPYDTDWDKIQNLGIIPAGYIAWLRTGAGPAPSSNNFCGSSWSDASTNCASAVKCPSAQDNECPAGQKCFGGITCSGGGGGGGGSVNLCGISWTDASTKCSTATKCPGGSDGECPSGQKCFGGITCSGGGGGGSGVNLCGTNWDTVNCGTSVRCPGGSDGECPSGQKCWGNNKC